MNPIVDDITHGLALLAQTLIGLLLMVAGLGSLVWEKLNPPSHDAHMLAELLVALLGAAIVPSVGPVLIKSLKALVGILLSVVPARPPKDGA